MALRILLADESATIKKVIELSLQDYSVELKTVNLGVDVLQVAKSFQPDLVFVDILLQKKNGYEVCHELKQASETKNIPVVILWSGFMELDPQKMQVCGADSSLEKPFDSEALRALVNRYVPRIKEANPLLQHVQVPKIQRPEEFTQIQTPAEHTQTQSSEESKSWNMDSFDDLPELDLSSENLEENIEELEDDFSQFEINTSLSKNNIKVDTMIDNDAPEDDEEGSAWVSKKLGKFHLDIPDQEEAFDELTNLEIPEVEVASDDTSFLWSSENSQVSPQDPPFKSTETSASQNKEEDEISPYPVESPSFELDSLEEPEELHEVSLDETASAVLNIERNEDLGIEVHKPEKEHKSTEEYSAPSSINNSTDFDSQLESFLQSDKFHRMVEIKLEQRLQKMVERLVPDMAKQAIETEIQRLLNDPYE